MWSETAQPLLVPELQLDWQEGEVGLAVCPVSLKVNDEGNLSPAVSMTYSTIAFISPVWPSLEKQDLNAHTLYFSSLEFSFKQSVS